MSKLQELIHSIYSETTNREICNVTGPIGEDIDSITMVMFLLSLEEKMGKNFNWSQISKKTSFIELEEILLHISEEEVTGNGK